VKRCFLDKMSIATNRLPFDLFQLTLELDPQLGLVFVRVILK
jgi:hypothetical protein